MRFPGDTKSINRIVVTWTIIIERIYQIAQEESSIALVAFKRGEEITADEAAIMACDWELLLATFSDILCFEPFDPTVVEDGDIEGTVDIDDPGDVELEFILRWT